MLCPINVFGTVHHWCTFRAKEMHSTYYKTTSLKYFQKSFLFRIAIQISKANGTHIIQYKEKKVKCNFIKPLLGQ
jgi:hypothetical protein